MEHTSFFIKDKCLFGNYPDANMIRELRSNQVHIYIDMTHPQDHLSSYINLLNDNDHYYSYPILDRECPSDLYQFCLFLYKIYDVYKEEVTEKNKMYIHCKGGHGRAGIMVACLLCLIYKYPPEQAIEYTTKYHSERKCLKQKWKDIGSPQTRAQKSCIFKLFKPLYFFKATMQGPLCGFSTFSYHSIYIESVGTFPTLENAYQAYRDILNPKFIQKLKTCLPGYAKKIKGGIELSIKDKKKIMKKLCIRKLEKYDDVKHALLKTYCRPIYYTGKDILWGGDNNEFGKIWMDIRDTMLYHRH